MQKFNPGNKLNNTIIIMLLVALVCAIIKPLAGFGALLAMATFVMSIAQAIINTVKRSKNQQTSIASIGNITLGAGKLAIASFVILMIAGSMLSPATPSNNPTPQATQSTITVDEKTQKKVKEAEAKRKKAAEERKKRAAEAKKKAKEAAEQAKKEQQQLTANADKTANSKALDALNALPIKGRAPKTGYSRDQFGTAWSDIDHNGCDTRNDILNRDLTNTTHKNGTHNCVVLTGTLNDPYTATTINFQRGQSTSSKVQIDHVVALSNAWQTGAQQLTPTSRLALANDPYNLLAVDGSANQQKSDGDAATWLPANKSYRCEYVARQIGVKTKYSLWVTQAEHDAMANVLSSCPTQTIPALGGVFTPIQQVQETQSQPQQAPAQPATPQPQQETPAPAPTPAPQNVYYANCSAAKVAGAAPIYKGQPGYSSKLDRDGDGIACEK